MDVLVQPAATPHSACETRTFRGVNGEGDKREEF